MSSECKAFPDAVAIIFNIEGWRSNDPDDPGGETVLGIARTRHPSIPWPPTPEQCVDLYRQEYWDANRCGDMPWKFGLCLFDGDVNQGDVPAARLLQTALGLKPDGQIGPVSLAKIGAATNADLARFMALRAATYSKLPTFAKYRDGWFDRLFVVHGLALASEARNG